MRAILSRAELIQASSYHKEDGLLVVQEQHCFLLSEKDGVYLETQLQAKDFQPGEMLIPQRSLRALVYADDNEVCFFKNDRSSGYIGSLGTSRMEKGATPQLSTPHPVALASPLRDFQGSQSGWVLPNHSFRRGLSILQRFGPIQAFHGLMVAKGRHENIVVRSANFDIPSFSIVPAAVDPLITLLKSNKEVVVKTGAGKTIVQAGDVALGWFASPEKPINIHRLPAACTLRVLRHDFKRRLMIANKGTATLICQPEEAVLSVEKEGLRSPLKMKVVSGTAVAVRIDPVALHSHVSAMKGAEIEIAVGPRWVQLRGAEVVPGTKGEILEVTTLLAGEGPTVPSSP